MVGKKKIHEAGDLEEGNYEVKHKITHFANMAGTSMLLDEKKMLVII